MAPRTRVYAAVALAATAAAALAVTGAIVTREHRGGTEAAKPRSGHPPLELDLGVRDDPYARKLRRVQELYNGKQYAAAKRLVAGDPRLEARIAFLFASWPGSSLARLELLAREHPRDAFVVLHVGLARFWAGENGAAVQAWRRAQRVQPDTMSAIRAEDLLHPYFPGHPTFVPSFPFPARIARLRPPEQFRALRRAAATGGVHDKLLYGVALQKLGRSVSAEREYEAAARLAPNDVDAQVAAAVGRFDKDNLSASFSRLGPLSRRFPKAATVRFHLGLLLLWTGQVAEGKRQLRLAAKAGPETLLGREAKRVLSRLGSGGTG